MPAGFSFSTTEGNIFGIAVNEVLTRQILSGLTITITDQSQDSIEITGIEFVVWPHFEIETQYPAKFTLAVGKPIQKDSDAVDPVSGGIPPYLYEFDDEETEVPAGISLSAKGELQGTPTEVGLFLDVGVIVRDSLDTVMFFDRFDIEIVGTDHLLYFESYSPNEHASVGLPYTYVLFSHFL